jgi:hypothetical protein
MTNINVMTKEEKKLKIEELKKQAVEIKKEIEYYNAMQTALKLVLNGSYGAFATAYFILFNNHVAGTITAQGRDLTKTMDRVNEDYWDNQWHLDFELQKKVELMLKFIRAYDSYSTRMNIFDNKKTTSEFLNVRNYFIKLFI